MSGTALVKVETVRNPDIEDAATLLALQRLAASRVRLRAFTAELAARHSRQGGLFSPRSGTMRALMSLGSLGATRLPWFRWALSAFWMWRSFRRR